MYAALWRLLPGPLWVRIPLALALAGAMIAALMIWVFPSILPYVSIQDATVQQ